MAFCAQVSSYLSCSLKLIFFSTGLTVEGRHEGPLSSGIHGSKQKSRILSCFSSSSNARIRLIVPS